MAEAEHWGPVEVAWPTPEDMLEESELGDRVSWWLLIGDLHNLYVDRAHAWTMTLFAQRAHAPGPVPVEWWPKEARR